MESRNTFQSWANSHVFYDHLLQRPKSNELIALQGAAWRSRQLLETPNGSLLLKNSMFKALETDKKLYLMHVSHQLEKIEDHGTMYPSGGCLVGAVYCAPLFKEGDSFRMHNLGQYILNQEAPLSLRNLGRKEPAKPVLIELSVPQSAYRGLAGIDYLRLGNVHLQIFLQLEYLLSRSEREKLTESVVARIKNSAGFLSECSTTVYDAQKLNPTAFLSRLSASIDTLPILGYLYFEALSEYLMLHTTSPRSQQLKALGEMDNWIYKELLFGLSPKMAGGFSLSKFKPTPDQVARFVENLDATIDIKHMLDYTAHRITYLVNARFFDRNLNPADWQHMRWEFQELRQHCPGLLGHLIHREMRSFGRYPEFYFYFDQYKALEAWNYWNHMDVVAPFNGTMPKGEIGINPAYPDLKYKVFEAKQISPSHLIAHRQLDIVIAPRLVDLRHTLMRDRKSTAVDAAEAAAKSSKALL